MTEVRSSDLDAAGRVTIAARRLARAYPFHAAIIGKWTTVPSDTVGTMGVTIRDNRIHLLFDPNFVVSCSMDELVGVLLHEVHHILFGHVFVDRSKYADQEARVIAEELTVNEWITEPLPGEPIVLEAYPQLPPDETTDQRYRRLVSPRPEAPARDTGQHQKDAPGQVEPLDNHDVWEEIRETGVLGRLTIKAAIQEAVQSIDTADLSKLRTPLRKAIEKAIGHIPGDDIEQVVGVGVAAVDWRGALARIVAQQLTVRPVFNRPPRRFPHLIGIVPGRSRRPHTPTVLAVIDTSGSIDAATIGEISIELAALSRHAEVVVLECDAEIHAIYEYHPPLESVSGRGGTDLRPPFEADIIRKHRPDAIIYFTDGYGPAPDHPPSFPVFWCLTADGIPPARWGLVLRMVA